MSKPEWLHFEDLVANLQRKFAAGALVTQNERILGKLSRTKRQLDITIRFKVGGETMLIVVECKKHRRKTDVKDVGEFSKMLSEVSANKGMIISESGFTVAAHRLAECENISLYRYEDTIKTGWPDGLQTNAILEIWEIRPVSAYLRRNDGTIVPIQSDEEHTFFSKDGGTECPLATLYRLAWEELPPEAQTTGHHCLEFDTSTPDDSAICAVGLQFDTFKHMQVRNGRLQFEGLVNDTNYSVRMCDWKMVFPQSTPEEPYSSIKRKVSSLSLKIRSTFVNINSSKECSKLNLLLSGIIEIGVGSKEPFDLQFTQPN